ncbi:MAG: hypothetical protein ACLPLR_05500 [Terriglobales bacterium]
MSKYGKEYEEQSASNTIFALRQKSNEYLLAGDIDEFNRMLAVIATLESVYKITSGRGKNNDNRDNRTA